MAEHNALGKLGEEEAVRFLLKNGYQILERNYRYQKAEVDILAKKDGILAVVEVKTRSSSFFGSPQDFLKPKQIQRLITAVDAYITINALDLEVRFDIIAIVKTKKGLELEHLENAFYHF
ncbi:YraN family protein [Formosa sp. PL04]|uniref:YraN family protein n=1 Tax=Formosa sp. PL04 TaxID=3081755 RepID=UPI002982753F|nr:YraN family protein [Formosa sp. PL04]MDW5290852.1 YraN family protein [Formosa sp. PL04]